MKLRHLPGEQLLDQGQLFVTAPAAGTEVLSGEIETYSMEKRYFRKDRSLVWINLTVSLVRTAAGEPRHFISVVEDITERKRAEEAFRASEARLAAGADLAGLRFVEVDESTGTVFADERLRELLGVPPDWEQGMRIVEFWREHLHPDDRPPLSYFSARRPDPSLHREGKLP